MYFCSILKLLQNHFKKLAIFSKGVLSEFTLKKRTNVSFYSFFVDFVFPGSLFCLSGFFISDSWIIWDIG
ncbi:hypothetical protein RhiirB3_460161 [Rhizophagus irregularis]|nr:hypothetical protein RhiirB3_460161 [Rhizophagus irregularis]